MLTRCATLYAYLIMKGTDTEWFIIPYGLPSVLPVAPGVPASSSHMRDVRHLHTAQMRREPERLCDQRYRSVSGV